MKGMNTLFSLVVGILFGLLTACGGTDFSGPLLGQESQEVPKEFASHQDLLEYFDYNVHMLPSETPENVVDQQELRTLAVNWNDLTINGKEYVGRIIRSWCVSTYVNGYDDVTPICSIAPGETYTVEETIKVCGMVKKSINVSFSAKLLGKIGVSLGLGQSISKEKCYTVKEGRKYEFPYNLNKCQNKNSATFYTAIGYDLWRSSLEIAPYEVRDRVELRLCLRECAKYKDADQAAQCRQLCNAHWGYQPNFDKISIWNTDFQKPVQRHFVNCGSTPF